MDAWMDTLSRVWGKAVVPKPAGAALPSESESEGRMQNNESCRDIATIHFLVRRSNVSLQTAVREPWWVGGLFMSCSFARCAELPAAAWEACMVSLPGQQTPHDGPASASQHGTDWERLEHPPQK